MTDFLALTLPYTEGFTEAGDCAHDNLSVARIACVFAARRLCVATRPSPTS